MATSPRFDAWLARLESEFTALSWSEQEETLDALLSCMDAHRRWSWHEHCFARLHADPVVAMPPEIVHKLFSLLDANALSNAARVCTKWRQAVNCDRALWRRTATMLGAKDQQEEGEFDSAEKYRWSALWCLHHRQRLRSGKALTVRPLRRPLQPSAHITAMDYCQGRVAIAASDEDSDSSLVAVWCTRQHRLLCKLRVARHLTSGVRITVIRLLKNNTVCLGFVEGGLYFCKINVEEDENKGEGLQALNGFIAIPNAHASSVFSIDGAETCDFVTSGSADSTARLWRLRSSTSGRGSSMQPIKTLTSQADWVVSVKLRLRVSHDKTWMLATMSKKEIHVFFFDDPEQFGKTEASAPKCVIPLKNAEVYEELREMFFTPGLHLSDHEVTFVRQMPIFDTQTIGDADIVCVDVHSGKLVKTVHVNQKIRKLLAVGKNFALALLPYVDTKYKNLAVIDLNQKKIVGGCTVPHSRATSPDFSQMFVGDTTWLDGLDRKQVTQSAVVAGLLVHNGHAYLVEWK